jgi:hypothetical protein
MEARVQMKTNNTDFLAGYLDLEPFAATVNREPRTVRRWMSGPDGLPYTRIGNRVLIHIPTAREWLFSRMRHPNPRREREAATQNAAA